ncbi:MAG: PKD domain-containing protein, partial [Bacteroidia bacterium]|nr:PKD domain-containing protein [Bacteroidia bacterium]
YGFGERESYGYAGDVVLNNIALRIVTSADQAGLARECADSLITFTGINQGVVTSWQWDFGDGSPTVSGQVVSHAYSQPGTYFVKLRVTTPSICNVDSSIRQIDIFRPDYSVVNLSPAACGQPTGAATLALAGGVAPYQYAIGNGPFQNAGADNQASLTGLSSGPVVVRFRDAIGCAFVDTLNIPEATDLVLSGQITHVSCFGGADGSVSLTAQGGTPPYLYRLGTGSLQPSNVFPGLSAGTYQFFVVDVNNCSQSLTVQVQQPDQPFTVSIEATANTICAGQSVTLSASPAVSYFWQPGNFTGSAYSPSPGATTTYTLRALNENGCEAVAEYTVEVYNPCPCFWEGIINRYAAVSAVDYCLNTADVADDGAFSPGDTVMLIQMTGAQINLSNTPDFGTITDLGKTGNFEWAEIQSIEPIGGGLRRIFFRYGLLNDYDPVNGKVQMVSVPNCDNVRITGTLTAPEWNGQTGGVLVFNVRNTLDLGDPAVAMDVSGKGFAGGPMQVAVMVDEPDYNYFHPDLSPLGARKGESVWERLTMYSNGRGAPANGGGGGNNHNAGGGGGANAGSGGRGGFDWIIGADVGGIGGRSLIYNSVQPKIFMGGGGGSGHVNTSCGMGSPGARGGGVIVFKTSGLVVRNNRISASGANAEDAPDCDAAGGGGGGGTVVADYQNVVVAGSLDFELRGGRGGNTLWPPPFPGRCVGPGGGGGGGALLTSIPIAFPGTNDVSGGGAGFHANPTSPCFPSNFGALPGNAGIIQSSWRIPMSNQPRVPDLLSLSVEPAQICDGEGAIISAIAAPDDDYIFTLVNDSSIFSGSIIVYPSVTTTYTVVAQNQVTGCTAESQIIVSVSPQADLTVSANSTQICAGKTATLSVEGADYFLWRPGNFVGSVYVVSPPVTTTYTVVGSYDLGC